MGINSGKTISFRSEFGSKRYVFMKNDKIITFTNLCQHEIYLNGMKSMKKDHSTGHFPGKYI